MSAPDPFETKPIPDMTIPDRADDPPAPLRRLPQTSLPQTSSAASDALQGLAPLAAPVAPPQPAGWKLGAKVWAPWEPTFAYPGAISEISEPSKQALIVYADDGRAWVLLDQLLPLALEPGIKVGCRRNRGVFFFPATIIDRRGDEVCVRFDDNHDEEWTVAAALRLAIDNVGPGAEAIDFGRGMGSHKNLRSGGRVWAPWEADMLYPGTVDQMRGLRAHVRYDDGGRAWVMQEQLLPLDIPVGLRLLILEGTQGEWMPGKVTEVDDGEVLVEYDNYRLEWVTPASLAMQTVPRGPEAQPTRHPGEWKFPGWAWLSVPAAIVMVGVMRGCSG